jgi:hypothetical protein
VFFLNLNRIVAGLMCVTVVAIGIPRPSLAAPAAASATPLASAVRASSHLLRDTIPIASFVAPPPDSTEDDDFFLPPETDKKKLIREVTVFLIVSAFVAYFFIKVFLEKDPPAPTKPTNGKSIPPPA